MAGIPRQLRANQWRAALSTLIAGSLHEEQLDPVLSAPVPPPLPVSERPAVESSHAFGGALRETAQRSPSAPVRLPELTLDVPA
jgi:hypothetical protein